MQRQSPLNIAVVGAVLLLAAYSVQFIIAALSNALLFDGYAADGAFQALNPMRRLAAGEAIGADFNTFHGVGVPLLHLPFYYLFGQGLFASELGRWLLSPFLFMVSTFGFFYAFKRSIKTALVATAVITAVTMAVMSLFVLPFTSMLGVRSVMAVLVAIIMLKQMKLAKPLSVKYSWLTWYELLIGLALVASLLCGTEFGIAAILSFFLVHMIYRTGPATSWKSRALSAVRILGVFVVFLFMTLTIITRGHPLQPLQYAFSTIPADQFWYFGVPPNRFLHADNIFSVFLADTHLLRLWFLALVAVGVVVAVHRLRTRRIETQVFIFALLAGAFAMVSMAGYYHYSEAFALGRMSLLVIGAGGILLWRQHAGRSKIDLTLTLGSKKHRCTTRHVFMITTVLFACWTVVQTVQIANSTIEQYDIKKVVRKTKSYILGEDTNVLDVPWSRDLSMLMPTIQADNTIDIVDVNENGFERGINRKERQVIVDPGDYAAFVRPGQVLYFSKSGRQIIGAVTPYGDKKLLVTVQNVTTVLEPQYDGVPYKVIVAQDFKRDYTKVWSTYSTMFEVEMGTFNPSRQHADYIIHALGSELRKQYVDDFNAMQPRYVITLKKSYFVYEEWLQNASWDFYSLVDTNYEAVKEGTMHVLWKRRDQPWTNPLAQNDKWQNLDVADNGTRIDMPAVDFSSLPDVSVYINDQRLKDAEIQRNKGTDIEAHLLLPLDEYLKRLGESQADLLRRDQSKFEGQGHNTVTEEVDEKEREEEEKKRLTSGAELLQPRRAVVLVKLQYETKNPLEKVPLLGKTARFLVQPNNMYSRTQVSLAPYKNEVVFPIVLSELNRNSFLSIKNYSLLPATTETKIVSAQWQLLETSAANLKVLTDFPGPSLKQP